MPVFHEGFCIGLELFESLYIRKLLRKAPMPWAVPTLGWAGPLQSCAPPHRSLSGTGSASKRLEKAVTLQVTRFCHRADCQRTTRQPRATCVERFYNDDRANR